MSITILYTTHIALAIFIVYRVDVVLAHIVEVMLCY